MRYLPQIVLAVILFCISSFAQSPHGDDFDVDCSQCHNPTDWKVLPNSIQFDHTTTNFPLVGQHQTLSCRNCHATLKFTANKTDCISCHTDLHQGTVGKDCSKCHTPKSWMVEDINGLHQKSRFPLVGTHLIADCQQCHPRYTDLYFEPLDIDCYECHKNDFATGHSPDESKDCQNCHEINAASWKIVNVNHEFFPLVGGHAISCVDCHGQGTNFTGLSPQCVNCHLDDYNSTEDPNHSLAGFPTDCEQCHTIMGWEPANFDHNLTEFPLTGAHVNKNCNSCHEQGYTNTPTECYVCHQDDFNMTTDPNHVTGGYSTDCTICHNTTAWELAQIDHNLTGFPLTGKHIDANCQDCHESGYMNTPTDCYACHQPEYNSSTNPNHIAAQFPITCQDCHTTNGWEPATFDHDGLFFPIYTGEHAGGWNQCIDCHEVPNNYSVFTCISCHEHNQVDMDDKHSDVQGYIYESGACLSCHPDGTKGNAFNHNNSIFPLTGAHLTTDCQQCHQTGYQGTPTQCVECHQANYNNSSNPNHQTLMLPTDCEQCHTTNPGWGPATFPIHNQYFELLGAHSNITNCDDCHSGNFTTTSILCFDCHPDPYNNAQNPNHMAAGIPTECEQCHNSTAWIPSTFNHTLAGFELTGSHLNIQCSSCHEGTIFGLNSECISCHQDDFNIAPDHVAQGYPTNCEMCHNSIAWIQVTFDHNATNFPLTGAHIGTNCSDCHESGFTGTTTICYDCHQPHYQQSSNPSHTLLSLPTDCEQCHTTNPNWEPATFPIHDQFFQLLGAHLNITNCDDCHNGNFNNTPNQCIDCHQNEYNGTNDPPHQILSFSFDCLECHNMSGWIPANFNHSFYPVDDRHEEINCNECHSQQNYQPQCLSCHMDDFLEEHNPGDPTDCWNCHDAHNWSIGTPIPKSSPKVN